MKTNKIYSCENNKGILASGNYSQEFIINNIGRYFYLKSLIWFSWQQKGAAGLNLNFNDPNFHCILNIQNVPIVIGTMTLPFDSFSNPGDIVANSNYFDITQPGQYWFEQLRFIETLKIVLNINNLDAANNISVYTSLIIEIQETGNYNPA
jgi:hypothetical protein